MKWYWYWIILAGFALLVILLLWIRRKFFYKSCPGCGWKESLSQTDEYFVNENDSIYYCPKCAKKL